MFVSRRRIGGKNYFYLEDREVGKRISVSLGQKERAIGQIDAGFSGLMHRKIAEAFKSAQADFAPQVLSQAEIIALEKLKIDYALMKEFFPDSFFAFKEDEFVRYAQGSASVEGNSLSLQEAALVLGKGISISGKTIDEIKEIENMSFAAKISGKIKELSERNIRKVHSAIMRGFESKMPGEYRVGPMFITGSKVHPPNGADVPSEMKKLLNWHGKNTGKIHPVELGAEFHARFELIHPFLDGNGRTGREILNAMLRIAGYPRAIINLQNRQSYIVLLERVQLNREYSNFAEFVSLCLEKRGKEIEKIVDENRPAILKNIAKKIR